MKPVPLHWIMIALGACATPEKAAEPKKPIELLPALGHKNARGPEEAVLSREAVHAPVALVGATLMIGNGKRIERGTIVLEGGKIAAIGPDARVPPGAKEVDVRGKFVTPGLIDTHSHLGVYAVPHTGPTADGNEMTDPTTPHVWSEHAFWPQDPSILRAVAGGVTTIQVLPGSANVIGGRAATLKLRPSLEARAMRFPGAPNGLKMACGENPKRVYGSKGQQPISRMGNIKKLREAWLKAKEHAFEVLAYEQAYAAWMKKYEAAKLDPMKAQDPGPEPRAPSRDLGSETLADAMAKKVRVHIHCYRADEMLLMISLAKELGFEIASFHHAVEAYKIAPVLAKEGIGASMWADWWGFKLEAYDAVEENAAIVAAAGGRAIIHSDSEILVQRLNQEAAKALYSGKRAGLALTEDDALQWITKHPAEALGVDRMTGTLEPAKMADVVVWSRDPFSIYAQAELVFIDGELVYDRTAAPKTWSDFEIGTDAEEVRP